MTPFTTLTAIAAPLPVENVDTDMILPARFLTTISRRGLGAGLFHAQRARPGFILDRQPWDRAEILIAQENFGCGSSREHAPWALLDFGIRCVIAPSFADIFFNNCCKNGILPLALPHETVDRLMALAMDPASATMTVDLVQQAVCAGELEWRFAFDRDRRALLMAGTDEIAQTLGDAGSIAIHEVERAMASPWLPHITQTALDML